MAQYKVPQDVEAEDKLIGPFSFRQFIYLGIAAAGIAVAVGLWQLFPGLVVIPLPVILLFLVLALPLRKDQPMETYLTAVIRFFLKPRKRLWHPEGSISLVTIVAPQVTQVQLTKSVGGAEASAQLDYLAQVVDSQGWATRGVVNPTASMNDIAYAEAQQAEDVLDENTNVARSFESMIDKSTDDHKQSVMEKFREAAQAAPDPTPTPATSTPAADTPGPRPTSPQVQPAPATTQPTDDDQTTFDYNPYPSNMHQHVVNPMASHSSQQVADSPQPSQPVSGSEVKGSQQEKATSHQPSATSLNPVSPDIMRLANNNDLSISALANEAHRLSEKSEEVIINLH